MNEKVYINEDSKDEIFIKDKLRRIFLDRLKEIPIEEQLKLFQNIK